MRFCRKLTMSLIYSFQQLNKQLIMNTTSKVIDIYIPRILGDVSNNIVKNAFYNLNIGKVIELDMHRKKNAYVHI